MDSEIAKLQERVDDLENDVKQVIADVGDLRLEHKALNQAILKIEIHSEYTRDSLDEIKVSVKEISEKQFNALYTDPLTKRLSREERVVGIIIIGIVMFVLAALFPGINWR